MSNRVRSAFFASDRQKIVIVLGFMIAGQPAAGGQGPRISCNRNCLHGRLYACVERHQYW
jgi:hypothetical protein